MDSGTVDLRVPRPLREFIGFLRSHYGLTPSDAQSLAFALREDNILVGEARPIRIMESPVTLSIALADLDEIAAQIKAERTPASESPPAPAPIPSVDAIAVAPAALQGWKLAATLPPGMALPDSPLVSGMREAFVQVIGQAQQVLRISSPYIESPGLNLVSDPLRATMARGVNLRLMVRIEKLKEPKPTLAGAIGDLYRNYGSSVEVRSYSQFVGPQDGPAPGEGRHGGTNVEPWVHWGGVHAKLLIADGNAAYVGSGEIRDHSLNRNFEVGFVIADSEPIALLCTLFDMVWDRAKPIDLAYCESFEWR